MRIIRSEGHRIYAEFSKGERARWREAVEAEERAKAENIASARKRMAALRADALAEDSFSGQLRRWIQDCGMPDTELAEKTGIALGQLRSFMQGSRGLSTDELNCLLPELHVVVQQDTSTG